MLTSDLEKIEKMDQEKEKVAVVWLCKTGREISQVCNGLCQNLCYRTIHNLDRDV